MLLKKQIVTNETNTGLLPIELKKTGVGTGSILGVMGAYCATYLQLNETSHVC